MMMALQRRQRASTRGAAFTLIELMAVVLVTAVLAAVTLGVSSYLQKRVATNATRAQLAAIEAALETYQSDWGYYPLTCPCRISYGGFCELTNNWILWRTLSGVGGGKKYMTFSSVQLRANTSSSSNLLTGGSSTPGGLTNIYDPWGTPLNYFNSPNVAYVVINTAFNGYTLGGQMNSRSYDLFSYGPDHSTFVPNATGTGWKPNALVSASQWTNQQSSADDVTAGGP